MTLGGSILRKYGGLPEPTPPTRDTPLRAGLVFLGGLSALLTLAWWGAISVNGLAVFRVVTWTALSAFILSRAWLGWKEDGPVGVVYRLKHPMGTMLGGDEDRSPTARGLGALFLLALLANLIVPLITRPAASSSAAPSPTPPITSGP